MEILNIILLSTANEATESMVSSGSVTEGTEFGLFYAVACAVIGGLITHFFDRRKLKQEQKIGHENMLEDKITDALKKARDLELRCDEFGIYKQQEVILQEGFNYASGNYPVYMSITKSEEEFNNFQSAVLELRKKDERYLGLNETACLLYMEKYCDDFKRIVEKYSLWYPFAGAMFMPDFQRWQKRLEKILVKKINKPLHKIYCKSGIKWMLSKKRVELSLYRCSLLYQFLSGKDCFDAKLIKAAIIDKNEDKVNEILDEMKLYDKKHPIRTFVRKIIRKIL